MSEPMFVTERDEIVIQTTANGWLVIQYATGEQPVGYVFEEDDNVATDHDPDAAARMLHQIVDLLGIFGSRHDAKRVRIIVEPGDKYETPVADPDPAPRKRRR